MNNLQWPHCNFVVLDVEGNGQNPQEIIELAIVHIRGKQIGHLRSWQFRPLRPVTNHANQIHGISNADLSECPTIDEVADDIRMELGSDIVVGHHVGVDLQLLRQQLGNWHPKAVIDTLKLARYARPGEGCYTLAALINTYSIESDPSQRHRASGDAIATAKLFLALTSEIDRDSRLDLLSLVQIAGRADDPFLQSQQRNLF